MAEERAALDRELHRRGASLLEERIRAAQWGRPLEPAILDAIRRVPRHLFVHPSQRALAYTDSALPTLAGMTTSAPSVVAFMIQLAGVRSSDRVLEVGTGTGYQAAVLAQLGARVVTLERLPSLGLAAARVLKDLGHERSVRVLLRNGRGGYPPGAPYRAIIVAAAASVIEVLRPLAAQLQAGGGRLVAPVGPPGDQALLLFVRRGARVTVHPVPGIRVDFVSLVEPV